jgi:hypothetical protein
VTGSSDGWGKSATRGAHNQLSREYPSDRVLREVVPNAGEVRVAVPRLVPAVWQDRAVQYDSERRGTATGRNVVDEKVNVADSGDVGEMMGRLPQEVVVALGDIAQVAREGLLALSVSTGLAVLDEMMVTGDTIEPYPVPGNAT